MVEISGDRIKLFADEFAFAEMIEKGTFAAECPEERTRPMRLLPFPIVIESEQKAPVLSLDEPT